mmetsp:Transcript_14120/g.20859  ORF Transcript_14120/g.20859 Transcript_14120/m.20859 type:complete len:675 (-) Transcript_14120:304-2328(-)
MLEDMNEKDGRLEGSRGNSTCTTSVTHSMSYVAPLALMALKLTSQQWNILGHGTDANVAASSELSVAVERLTSLFLVRIVAVVSNRNSIKYRDISTTSICTHTLKRNKPWPDPINESLIHQLRLFVHRILARYKDVHYHSFEHAYHVTISYNKLLDMMLVKNPAKKDVNTASLIINRSSSSDLSRAERSLVTTRKTYGLKEDPIAILAALFSALVHDVEHRGVSNRQLVMENDELALLYNDQSVAEQKSLAVAFSELMKDEFKVLRDVMFETSDEYRRFRRTVIDLVLATDIASPERTQLAKSKWKEAFGETKESIERKIRREQSLRSIYSTKKSVSLSSKSLLIEDDMPDEDNNAVTIEGIDGLTHIAIGHDNFDEDSPSATPESNDGLEPILEGTEKDHLSSSALLDATPDVPLCIKDTVETPKTRGGKKILRREELMDMENVKTQDTGHSAPPSFIRRQTHCGSMTSKIATPPKVNMQFPDRRTTLCRHFSSPDFGINKPIRLSIRRSLDLNGEAIENYPTPMRTSGSSFRSLPGINDEVDSETDDEPDELKAIVVLEHLMRAADIGPNMQGWQQMEKWSDRLFFELKTTYHNGFGEDPQNRWYQNQITFLESYILPLARRLGDMGVFGESIGPMFEEIVKQNRDKWVSDGFLVTSRVAEKWQSFSNKGSQ